jgi:hypothetical protein
MTSQEAVNEIQSVNSNPENTIAPTQALKTLLKAANRLLAQHVSKTEKKRTRRSNSITTTTAAQNRVVKCLQQSHIVKDEWDFVTMVFCSFCKMSHRSKQFYCVDKDEVMCTSCYDSGQNLIRIQAITEKDEEEELQEVEEGAAIEPLPEQTGTCVLGCLTKFENDVETCKTVLQICKAIIIQHEGRTAELRNQVLHAARVHMDETIIVQLTCELLQKLLDVNEGSDVDVLIVLNDFALEGLSKYQEDPISDTMLSVIKLIITLHDSHAELVREILLKSSLIKDIINIRSLQEYSNKEAFVEVATALIRRISSSFVEADCLKLSLKMKDVIRLYPANDLICEQVFGYFCERGEIETVHNTITLRFSLL